MKKHSLAIIIAITTFMTYAPTRAATTYTIHMKANACRTTGNSSYGLPIIDPQWGLGNPNSAWEVECPISVPAGNYARVDVTVNAYNRVAGGIIATLNKVNFDGTVPGAITSSFNTAQSAIQRQTLSLNLYGGSLSTSDDYFSLKVFGVAGTNFFPTYDVKVTTY